jgi:hypothetical protein
MLNSQCSMFIRRDSRDFAWFPRLRIEHWELRGIEHWSDPSEKPSLLFVKRAEYSNRHCFECVYSSLPEFVFQGRVVEFPNRLGTEFD